MADENHQTFEEAVKDICSDFGLSGHEATYRRVLIGSLERSTAGIYHISSLVSGNVPEDEARDIRELNKIMRASEVGRDVLEKCKIVGEGVPVIRTFVDHRVINPIFLLPSTGDDLKNAVELLTEAIHWRTEEEAKAELRQKGKER